MKKRFVVVFVVLGACSREAPHPPAPPTPNAGPAAKAAAADPAVTADPALSAADYTYGVYLNGGKVGWMRSTLTPGAKVSMGIELVAKVAGMGQVSDIRVDDRRTYDAKTGKLVGIGFVQEAATGSVRITGERQGEQLVLTINAGNATSKQTVSSKETLEDALAPTRLAQKGDVGATRSVVHFDASLQRTVRVDYRVAAIENKMLAGVATPAVRIEARYPDLGIDETSWYDRTGKVLETQVGGFFVARLEPPDVAKKLDFQQDLLVSAVVKAPKPISDAASLPKLTLTLTGFGEDLPPSSVRQTVSRLAGHGDKVQLQLSRDPPLPAGGSAKQPPEVAEDLAATPFIQSDAQEIVKAAARATQGAGTFAERVEHLIHFVFAHVRDEYVPAYSNALEALQSGRGDCTEHSVLFVALARASGIPARVAVGIAYWPPGGGFGWHAWAEVWGPDGRWYTVDPTWDQPIADATHIKLANGGPAEQARIVMLLGRLHITDMHM